MAALLCGGWLYIAKVTRPVESPTLPSPHSETSASCENDTASTSYLMLTLSRLLLCALVETKLKRLSSECSVSQGSGPR